MDSAPTNYLQKALDEFASRPLGTVKVLMVEDDPLVTDLVLTSLSQHGCVPYSTLNSTEAIALAEQFMPHVIILDLMMPQMTGEEVLEALKASDKLKDIPVIVFSNKSDTADIENVKHLGAAEYFVKSSTDPHVLVDAVKRHAEAHTAD